MGTHLWHSREKRYSVPGTPPNTVPSGLPLSLSSGGSGALAARNGGTPALSSGPPSGSGFFGARTGGTPEHSRVQATPSGTVGPHANAVQGHFAGRGWQNKDGVRLLFGKAACRRNALQTLYHDTAADRDYSKNQGQPSAHTASSTFLAWWSSCQRASWQWTIMSFTVNAKQKFARSQGANDRLDAARSA
ncbi:hypothetical protein ABBQ38_011492 [Trebouxia sp. C0009 RCD-2024]